MTDIDEKVDRLLADGSITQVDADAVHDFARFLKITAGIPRRAADRTAAEHRVFLTAYAELDPDGYRRQLGRDPRWAGVRGQISPRTDDGHRLVELVVQWQDETYGVKFMWRPDDPTHPTLLDALNWMVLDLDTTIPRLPGTDTETAGPTGG